MGNLVFDILNKKISALFFLKEVVKISCEIFL